MAENQMSNDVEKALESYFNSPINVYECGSDEDRPQNIQERPFLKTLPNGHTVYLQKTPKMRAKGSFALSLDNPIAGGSIESNTESSKFLNEMQERFRNVKDDVNLIIIDPDVVRGRYAMDENPRRSMLQSFYQYLQGKMSQDGVAKAIPLSEGDYGVLLEASVLDNSPLSLAVPVKGLGQYAIVISSQPDMPMHDMFTSIPGAEIRMGNEKIGKEHVRDMILLHELGHALDILNGRAKNDTVSDNILKRHRTECVADVHSVLQTAKKYGKTNVGALVSDIRIDNTVQGIAYIQQKMQGARGVQDDNDEIDMNGFAKKVLRENYEGQGFFASPEMKDFINANRLQAKPTGNKAVNKAPSSSETLEILQQNAQVYKIAEVLGSIASYTTSFCADEAVKTAEAKLKDGSLQKMTDKEIHKLSEKIVAENAFNKEQLTGLVMGIMTGQRTPEFLKIVERYQASTERFPDDPERKMQMAMQAQGMQVPQPRLTNEETLALNDWFKREMVEKLENAGANREALVETVAKEKDDARKEDNLYNQYKIAIMNQFFIENPDKANDKAKTFGTVRDVLRNMEQPVVEAKGAKAIEAFIKTEMKALDTGSKAVEMAKTRDITSMQPDAFAKAVAKESRNIKSLYSEEKNLQALAFAIRKDPEAWELASKSPLLAQKIEEKAKQKHPVWIEGIHLNLGQKNAGELKASSDEIALNRKILAASVLKSSDVAKTVDKGLLKKLEAELPKAQPTTQLRSKKKAEHTEAGEIQWNLINKGRSK